MTPGGPSSQPRGVGQRSIITKRHAGKQIVRQTYRQADITTSHRLRYVCDFPSAYSVVICGRNLFKRVGLAVPRGSRVVSGNAVP